MTSNDLTDAVLAQINVPLNALERPVFAYELDDAPQSGSEYVVVNLTRSFGGNVRGPLRTPCYWYLDVEAVGTLSNVRLYVDQCNDVLEGHTVTVDGATTTALQFLNETPVAQDDADQAIWSAHRIWSFSF